LEKSLAFKLSLKGHPSADTGYFHFIFSPFLLLFPERKGEQRG